MAIDQDIPEQAKTFHARLGLMYARSLELERRTLYGPDAQLRLYSIAPGASRTLLATLAEDANGKAGFSVRMEFAGGGIEAWSGQILSTFITWVVIQKVSEIELMRHDETLQRFKVTSLTRPIDAAHVYRIQLQPVQNI